MTELSRRAALGSLAAAAVTPLLPARAADQTLVVGLDLPLTGAGADAAILIRDGVETAIDMLNGRGGVAGYRFSLMTLDDATATAGQYDPAQAATNARKIVSDPAVIAAIGPENSGSGKAMSPILSRGGLATITPSATNPDLTSPKFAAQYRPAGPAVFFRTVTTDAYQGPSMVNFFQQTLKKKSVFILDDSGAYGVGLADAFEAHARATGLTVLGRDRVDPRQADYSAIFTKIKALAPDALYCGADEQAGVKLVKQSYDIVPRVVKGGGDGFFSPEITVGAGFPAAENWYVTVASPHVIGEPAAASFVKAFEAKYSHQPSDYTFTAYDAMLVIADAVARVASKGAVTRAAMRDAIATAKVQTLQGEVSFDENGDLASRTVSIYQIKQDPAYPPPDVVHTFRFVGTAPEV